MIYIGYNPVGKTLEQILVECGRKSNCQGVAIFLLGSDQVPAGRKVAEDFSLFSILKENAWLRGAVVEAHNDFFGEDVFRVRVPETAGMISRNDLCKHRTDCKSSHVCDSCERYEPHSFIDDEEKMRDFVEMKKEDFLASYSYLTEEEYDATEKEYKEGRNED